MSKKREKPSMDLFWGPSKKDNIQFQIALMKMRGEQIFIVDTEHENGGYYV